MLLTSYVKVEMNRGNLGYYNKAMNSKFKIGDEIEVPIELVSKNSYILVEVSCDVCNSKSETTYRNYNDCLNYGFYSCSKCKHIKRKITNKSKYGVDNYQNSDKAKKTKLLKYGDENFTGREKSKITCLKKYGEDNVSKLDFVKVKRKQTNNKNWGVDNVFQSDDIKKISKNSMMNKYGVEHATQNIEIFNKAQKAGFKIKNYNDRFYRGTYELDFIDYCLSKNIDVVNGPSIKYEFNGKIKIYHSDFFIESKNLICEVKSSYTYNSNKDLNDAKKSGSIKNGYNFIFIIDKDYTEFDSIISN
jgi:hypothetical protein